MDLVQISKMIPKKLLLAGAPKPLPPGVNRAAKKALKGPDPWMVHQSKQTLKPQSTKTGFQPINPNYNPFGVN